MTINIKELHRLTQAATPGPWKVGQYLGSPRQFVIHMDVGDKGRGSDVAFTSANFGNDETIANARLIAAANPATILELLDRLESAEKERDTLRAKIKQMERQEPVWFIDERGEPKRYHKSKADYCKYGGLDLLYALPGAHPKLESSVPDGWKLVPIEPTTEIRKAMHYAYWQSPQLPYHDRSPELWNAVYAALLEAAPEVKP